MYHHLDTIPAFDGQTESVIQSVIQYCTLQAMLLTHDKYTE